MIYIYIYILSSNYSFFEPCKVGLIALNCLGEVLGFLGYREAGQGSKVGMVNQSVPLIETI